MKNFIIGNYRLQIVWPQLIARRNDEGFDYTLQFHTTLRIGISKKRFWVVGVSVLGFGFGVDYEAPLQ